MISFQRITKLSVSCSSSLLCRRLVLELGSHGFGLDLQRFLLCFDGLELGDSIVHPTVSYCVYLLLRQTPPNTGQHPAATGQANHRGTVKSLAEPERAIYLANNEQENAIMNDNEIQSKVNVKTMICRNNRMAEEMDVEITAIQDAIKQHMSSAGLDKLTGADFKVIWK